MTYSERQARFIVWYKSSDGYSAIRLAIRNNCLVENDGAIEDNWKAKNKFITFESEILMKNIFTISCKMHWKYLKENLVNSTLSQSHTVKLSN